MSERESLNGEITVNRGNKRERMPLMRM